MDANIQTRNSELLLGAATALSNQWSPNWIKKLERLATAFRTHENGEPVGKSRSETLKDSPELEKLIVEAEKDFGSLERVVIVNFKDGRCISLWRFERRYILEFENENKENTRISLSREAMFCLAQIHGMSLTPEEFNYEHSLFSNS